MKKKERKKNDNALKKRRYEGKDNGLAGREAARYVQTLGAGHPRRELIEWDVRERLISCCTVKLNLRGKTRRIYKERGAINERHWLTVMDNAPVDFEREFM